MSRVIIGALCAALLVTPSLVGWADDPPSPAEPAADQTAPNETDQGEKPTVEAEIVVNAPRIEIPLQENPAATTVVGEAELSAMPKAVGADEALKLVPGVKIDNQLNGEKVHLSIRGQGLLTERGVRGVKVLLDGMPLNDPTGFAPDLYDVDWATVNRVEVLRGPASARPPPSEVPSMLALPTIPSWDALHPAVSHFPIVLLVVAPALVLLALLLRDQRRTLMLVALGLLAAGTVAVFLSASTGDEAKKVAPQTPEVTVAIEQHETLGSAVRAASTVLTVLLAGLLFGPRMLRRELSPKAFSVLAVAFLALALASAILVVDAAHSGGLLVHKLGVHAGIR